MASWGVTTPEPESPVRRVRDEVKDGMAVIACSALASSVMAFGVLLISKLAG